MKRKLLIIAVCLAVCLMGMGSIYAATSQTVEIDATYNPEDGSFTLGDTNLVDKDGYAGWIKADGETIGRVDVNVSNGSATVNGNIFNEALAGADKITITVQGPTTGGGGTTPPTEPVETPPTGPVVTPPSGDLGGGYVPGTGSNPGTTNTNTAKGVSIGSAAGGKVTSNVSSAKPGDTVTLTVSPDSGYKLDSLTIKYGAATIVPTKVSDTTYTFTMPAGAVSITPVFARTDSAPSASVSFVDVASDAYYAEAVAWCVSKGITNGVDAAHFGPDTACSRGMMATFLWRAAGSPEPASTSNPFADVSPSDYYYKAVLWAVEKGVTNGVDAAHFGPSTACSRGMMAAFLYRAAGSPAVSGTASFSDVASGDYFATAVNWAVEKSITNGVDAAHYGPSTACSRGMMAAFLYRAYA